MLAVNYFIAAILCTYNMFMIHIEVIILLISCICDETILAKSIHHTRIHVGSIGPVITSSSRARCFHRWKIYSSYSSHRSSWSGCYSNRIRHHPCWSKFCWYSSTQMPMLSCHMTPDCIISGKRSWTIRTRYANTLMALTNMCPQISLVTVSAFAKWAPKFRTCNKKKLLIRSNVSSIHWQ